MVVAAMLSASASTEDIVLLESGKVSFVLPVCLRKGEIDGAFEDVTCRGERRVATCPR